jgi:hypothetical protein
MPLGIALEWTCDHRRLTGLRCRQDTRLLTIRSKAQNEIAGYSQAHASRNPSIIVHQSDVLLVSEDGLVMHIVGRHMTGR